MLEQILWSVIVYCCRWMNGWHVLMQSLSFFRHVLQRLTMKKGIKIKNKREQEIYTCTLLAFIITQENL